MKHSKCSLRRHIRQFSKKKRKKPKTKQKQSKTKTAKICYDHKISSEHPIFPVSVTKLSLIKHKKIGPMNHYCRVGCNNSPPYPFLIFPVLSINDRKNNALG